MTDNDKRHTVHVPADLIEEIDDWATKLVEEHRRGDPLRAMPWTLDHMTDDELRAWRASREEAGRAIDIETCELGRWPANDFDPYGIRAELSELPDEMCQLGTNRFVRSPESCGWVWEGDLPTEKGKAMYGRIHREWRARQQ